MDGSPDTEQHSNHTCAEDVKRAASGVTRFPADHVGAIAKKERTHVRFGRFGQCLLAALHEAAPSVVCGRTILLLPH